MKIKCLTGKLQNCYFSNNNGININDILINCTFNNYEWSNQNKLISILDILKINNINNFTITYKIYSLDYIKTLDVFKQEYFKYYNKLIHEKFNILLKISVLNGGSQKIIIFLADDLFKLSKLSKKPIKSREDLLKS